MEYLKQEGANMDWSESKAKARRITRSTVQFVQENPVPVLLIGAGLAWLIYDAQAEESSDATQMEFQSQSTAKMDITEYGLPAHYAETEGPGLVERAKQKSAELKDAIADKAQDIKHSASHSAEAVADKISSATQQIKQQLRQKSSRMSAALKDSMRDQYSRAQNRIKNASDQHPLAAGIGFLAVGVLAGLMIPETSRENQLMGSAASTLKEKTKEVSGDIVERGKQAIRAGYDAAKEEVQAATSQSSQNADLTSSASPDTPPVSTVEPASTEAGSATESGAGLMG